MCSAPLPRMDVKSSRSSQIPTSRSREEEDDKLDWEKPLRMLQPFAQTSPLPQMVETPPLLPLMMRLRGAAFSSSSLFAVFAPPPPLPRVMHEMRSPPRPHPPMSPLPRMREAQSSATLTFARWHPGVPPFRVPPWVTLIVACLHPCAPRSCGSSSSAGADFCDPALHLAAGLCRVCQQAL